MQTELITQTIITAIVTGLVSFLFTPFSMLLARRFRVIDNPQAHKLHQQSTPVMGGVAMWLAFVIGLLIFGRGEEPIQLAAIIGGGTLIACVGLIDDRFTLSPAVKLLGQGVAASVLVFGNVSSHLFPNFPILNAIITIVWVLAIVNALNLQDNIDGLAAGIAATAALSFLVLAVLHNQFLIAILSATLLGACAGFLSYNFQPAVTFMGDTGALLLGFILAILGLKISFPTITQAQSWLVPILVLGLPIFDTMLVMISRTRRRIPIWRGGTDHTSHRLVRVGLSHRRAVLNLYLVSLSLGVLAILVANATNLLVAWWTLGLLVIIAIALIILLEYVLATEGDEVSQNLKVLYIPGGNDTENSFKGILSAAAKVSVLIHTPADTTHTSSFDQFTNTLISIASNDQSIIAGLLNTETSIPVDLNRRFEWANSTLRLRADFIASNTLPTEKLLESFLKRFDLVVLSGGFEVNVQDILDVTQLLQAINNANVSVIDLNSSPQDLQLLKDSGLPLLRLTSQQTHSKEDIAQKIRQAWISRNNSRSRQLLA